MKSSNTVVTIVVIAAVLIAAYAVGRVIHQARVGDSASTGVEANDVPTPSDTSKLSHGPGAGQTQDTPEERARLKEKRAETLEKMESATEEQKKQFRDQVRNRFGERRGATGPQTSSPRRAVVPDPNTSTRPNSEKTGSEPNVPGQG